MKKIILTMVLLAVVCSILSGCIHWETPAAYELLQDPSNIQSIRIYAEKDTLYDYSDPNEPCGELLGEIAPEQFTVFTQELTALPFIKQHLIILFPVALDPNFYYFGPIVKIEYGDGSCELISCAIQNQFTVNEKYPDAFRCHLDDEPWLAFLQNWVDLSVTNK